MRMTSTLAAIAAVFGTSGAALADTDEPVGKSQALPLATELVKAEMDRIGYDVLSLKSDDGLLKARIRDRDTGGVVKATFDPATGELLRAKLAF